MAEEPRIPESWRKDILETAGERNRRAIDRAMTELKTLLQTHHTEAMGAIKKVADQQAIHNAWIQVRDQAQAVLDQERAETEREKNEQAMKARWQAEQAAQAKADHDALEALAAQKRKERHDRWNPYLMTFVGGASTAVFALVLYTLDNINTLRWGTQAYAIIATILVLSTILLVLFRLNV